MCEKSQERDFVDLSGAYIKVFTMLRDYPAMRDNDRLLIATIWSKELGIGLDNPVLQALIDHKISHPESIRRSRQDLQHNKTELQGETYAQRHKMGAYVCHQLKQLTFHSLWGW